MYTIQENTLVIHDDVISLQAGDLEGVPGDIKHLVGGRLLEAIHENALRFCRKLETLSCPNVITLHTASLPTQYLKTLNMPKLKALLSGDFLRAECLETVILKDITEVPDHVFLGCTKLKTVVMPNVLRVGSHAFVQCSGLVKVDMPNLTYMGENAFGMCLSLVEVNWPKLTGLPRNAIFGSRLNTLCLPNCETLHLRALTFLTQTNQNLSTTVDTGSKVNTLIAPLLKQVISDELFSIHKPVLLSRCLIPSHLQAQMINMGFIQTEGWVASDKAKVGQIIKHIGCFCRDFTSEAIKQLFPNAYECTPSIQIFGCDQDFSIANHLSLYDLSLFRQVCKNTYHNNLLVCDGNHLNS